MRYRIYPARVEWERIEKAAKLEGWPSPSAFIIRAAVDRAMQAVNRAYGAPDSPEHQQALVIRAVSDGAFTETDVAEQTGLDRQTARLCLEELANAGKLTRFQPERKVQGPKLLAIYKLPEKASDQST